MTALKATVLVTGGEERAALAIVRSLGRAGHRVLVGAEAGRSLAAASRYAAGEVALGDPLRDPAGFGAAAARAVAAESVGIVLPVTEPDLLALLPRKADLAPAEVPFPDVEVFLAGSDKGRVAELARRVGFGIPGQRVVERGEVGELLDRAPGPTVLKPSRSVRGGVKMGVSYVDAGEALRSRVQALPDEAFPLLVQDRVVGPGVGIFMLRWDGRIVAEFAHRRLREKPPSGGVSVLRESVPLDPGLRRMAANLLEALGWRGVAMIELKLDAADGTPYVMELNGRFWGSLQLAVDAGVDFPRILVDAARGELPEEPPAYRPGVRTRWLLGDVDHLLLRLRRSREHLNLPPDAPGRWAALAGFFGAFLPPVRSEMLKLRDPAPFGRELARWIAAVGGE